MDPRRKRSKRLFVLLAAALLMSGALVYTSISASTEAKSPSNLLNGAKPGKSYELTGKVVSGSIKRSGETLRFEIRDREGTAKVPVIYRGSVPDPFRARREVIVTGTMTGGVFDARKDSLVTKCPSKFTKASSQ